jgi:hypothetical protein
MSEVNLNQAIDDAAMRQRCEDEARAMLLDLLTREDFVGELKDLSDELLRTGRPDGSGKVALKGETKELLAFVITVLREPLLEWLNNGTASTSKH